MSGSNLNWLQPATANPDFYTQSLQNLNVYKEQQARYAAAQAYQQATDPTTGQVDPARFNALVTQDPRSAWNAGQLMQQQGNAQAAQADAQHQQLVLHNARVSVLTGLLSPVLAAKGEATTAQDLTNAVGQAVRGGFMTTTEANQAVSQINNAPDGDYFKLGRGWMQGLTSGSDQLSTVMPKLDVQHLGDRAQVINLQPGQPTSAQPGQTYQVGISPDVASDIVSLHVPGQPDQQMTRAQAQVALRQNPALVPLNRDWNTTTAPAATGTTTGPAAPAAGTSTTTPPPARTTTTPPPATTTTPPPATAFQPTAARADAAGIAAPKAGTIPAYGSPGAPGQLAVKEQQAQTGGALAQQLEQQGQDAASVTSPQLAQMLAEIDATGATGIFTPAIGRIRQFAAATGLDVPSVDMTTQQGAQEALGKLYAQFESKQLGSLGSNPSDSRQSLAAAGSPSLLNTQAGNRQIIHNLQGNNDALDTMYRAWMGSQTRANNPGNFAAWRNAFTAPVKGGPLDGARFDPTVFSVRRMPAPEAYAYLKSLQTASPADFAQFRKDWELALKENWVSRLTPASAAVGTP